MKLRYRVIAACGLFVLAQASSYAIASGKVPAAPAPAKVPALVTSTCSACHGMTGVSLVPTFPSLAAQGAPYIVKQIRDFQDKKRADAMAKSTMWGIAATIPKGKTQEIAQYFSEQKGVPGVPEQKAEVAAGRAIYMGGIASSTTPACMACHGATGLGLPPLFPRLAGQHMAYIVAQLQAFKTKQRTNDPLAIMRTIAGPLSAKQMTALAAFIRTL